MRNILKLIQTHFFLLLFLLFYLSVTAYKFISHPAPFYDWDEAINAQVAREMIEKKSLVPLWQGEYWLDKPPLPFLFFAAVVELTPFLSPEISLRFATLTLSIIALIFVYLLYLKATKEKFIPLLTVIVTAFAPIFLQRAQVVNLDVFLLIGWLGYLLFFNNFYLSLFFLTISVLTKSLLGFYPVFILTFYYLYLFFIKKIKKNELKKIIFKLGIQIIILAVWYLVMFSIFGKSFWQQHIIETHFKRVTSSIEFHFGKRTYYLDLMFEQLSILTWFFPVGFFFIFYLFLKKKISSFQFLISNFLIFWFIFLNLTKTKIFWYLYPAIPQFAFLSLFPLQFIKKKRFFYYGSGIIIIGLLIFQNFFQSKFFTTFYSRYESRHFLVLYAKDYCDSMTILVDKDTRSAFATLEKMGLLIASSKQWGNYPSIVYYFGKKVNFLYQPEKFIQAQQRAAIRQCFVVRNDDSAFNLPLEKFSQRREFNDLNLFVK